MGRCGTVEEFYSIYCYLPVIGTEQATNYSLFREGIEPLWEDPANSQGGRTILLINGTELAPMLWEKLVVVLGLFHSSCYSRYLSHLTWAMKSAEFL